MSSGGGSEVSFVILVSGKSSLLLGDGGWSLKYFSKIFVVGERISRDRAGLQANSSTVGSGL